MGDSYDDYECEQALYEAALEDYTAYPTWRMRDGTVIHMKDMTTRHLKNCIALMNRRIASRTRPLKIHHSAWTVLSCLNEEYNSRKDRDAP